MKINHLFLSNIKTLPELVLGAVFLYLNSINDWTTDPVQLTLSYYKYLDIMSFAHLNNLGKSFYHEIVVYMCTNNIDANQMRFSIITFATHYQSYAKYNDGITYNGFITYLQGIKFPLQESEKLILQGFFDYFLLSQ